MSRIDGAQQLVALIRAQLSLARPAKRPARATEDVGSTRRPAKAVASDRLSPEASLVLRLKAISPDDEDARGKAFRLFLEAVLEREFGMKGSASGEVSRLIDEIFARMRQDTQLHELSSAAADVLLEQAWNLNSDQPDIRS